MQGEHSATIGTSSGADTVLEEKGEKKEINGITMVNIQHVTLNNMAQLEKLCMSIGIKGGLPKNEVT